MDILAQIDGLSEMIRTGETGGAQLRLTKLRVAVQKLEDDAAQLRAKEKEWQRKFQEFYKRRVEAKRAVRALEVEADGAHAKQRKKNGHRRRTS